MISTNIVEQDLVLRILAVFGENGVQFVEWRTIWAACGNAQAVQIIRCPYSLTISLAARAPYIRMIYTDINVKVPMAFVMTSEVFFWWWVMT